MKTDINQEILKEIENFIKDNKKYDRLVLFTQKKRCKDVLWPHNIIL